MDACDCRLGYIVLQNDRYYYLYNIRSASKFDECGLSQRKLHELTGIRLQTINEYTRELTDHLNIDHLAKICEALNCGVSDILVLMTDAGEPVELPVLEPGIDAFEALQKIAYQIRPLLNERQSEKVLVHQ